MKENSPEDNWFYLLDELENWGNQANLKIVVQKVEFCPLNIPVRRCRHFGEQEITCPMSGNHHDFQYDDVSVPEMGINFSERKHVLCFLCT